MVGRRCDRLLAAAAAVAATTSMLACDTVAPFFGGDSNQRGEATNRAPSTIIVGRVGDALGLDPARITDNESVEVIEQIYEKLLYYEAETKTIRPGLATSWEVSPDGEVWTFHLRPKVRFHDGTPLDADAVVFSLERQRDPFHPFHRKDFAYWANTYQNIIKVEAVDDLTVRITILDAYAPFEANMAMFPVSIVSPTAVEKWGDDFRTHPVGTGPFRFKSWAPGKRIVLARNDDYWGGKPWLQHLVFQVIPDGRHRLIALESGSIDIAYSILPEELQFVELHPHLVLHRTPANNVAYLAMNTTRPPFDDPRVRIAANYAVNKEPIVQLVYQGQAIPAEGPLPPTQWGYHKLQTPYTYQPERARALLAESEADGRFDPNKIHTMYVPSTPRPYLPDPERVGRVLQSNLADVGIRMRLVVQDFPTHLQSVQTGAHDTCLLGWVGDNGDPDNFLYVLLSRDNAVPGLARNVAFFRDAELAGLLEWAQQSEDRSERERYYARAQDLIHEHAPWVPIAHSEVAVAARTDLAGLMLTPSNHVLYKHVRREPR